MLPQVCVRSGRPAETALRYQFTSKSTGDAIDAIMANRVSGLILLTRDQRRLVLAVRGAEALGGAGGGAMIVAGIVLTFTNSFLEVGVLLIAFGLLFFGAEVLWRFTGSPFMGPKGQMLETPGGGEHIVALRRVHPGERSGKRGP